MKVSRICVMLTTFNLISILTYRSAFSKTVTASFLPEDHIPRERVSRSLYFGLGDPIKALNFIFSAKTSAFLLSLFLTANVAIIIAWTLLHYSYWDPKKTNSTNKVRWLRQIDFFTNPDTAMENIMITWVNALSLTVFWILPTLLWTGQPLAVDGGVQDGQSGGDSRISPLVITQGDPDNDLMDRVLCPNCVLTHILISVLVLITRFSTWSWLPYLRPFFVRETEDSGMSGRKSSTTDAITNQVWSNLTRPMNH